MLDKDNASEFAMAQYTLFLNGQSKSPSAQNQKRLLNRLYLNAILLLLEDNVLGLDCLNYQYIVQSKLYRVHAR